MTNDTNLAKIALNMQETDIQQEINDRIAAAEEMAQEQKKAHAQAQEQALKELANQGTVFEDQTAG